MKRPVAIDRRVLVDTSAYFALTDIRDGEHRRALSVVRTERYLLYTTNYVLAETHALLLRRLGRDVAARFIADTDRGETEIVRVIEEDEQRAREIIFAQTDKSYTLADATSFAVRSATTSAPPSRSTATSSCLASRYSA